MVDQECLYSWPPLRNIPSHYYTNDVIMSIINAFTAVLAILGNLAIIVAMKKKNLIQTPCDILLVSLALVDCVAASVSKPLFISWVLAVYHDHVTCDSSRLLAAAAGIVTVFCVGCSFTHMVLIAGDRYFALRGPVSYRTPNSKKVAVWVAGACWVVWSFLSFLSVDVVPARFKSFIKVPLSTMLLSVLVVFKVKTFVIIFRYNHSVINDASSLRIQRLVMRERRVLVDTRFSLITFMVLIIPTVVLSSVKPAGPYGNTVFLWSMTITLLASVINPVIHFWRKKTLRKAIVKVFWSFEQ